MKTDGGWVSISEAARLYGKSRKWVSNQISAYDIETQKEGNQTRFRLVDLIAHRGEPQGNGTTPTATPTEKSQKVAPEVSTLKRSSSSKRMVFCAGVLRSWRQIGRIGRRNGRSCRASLRGRQ